MSSGHLFYERNPTGPPQLQSRQALARPPPPTATRQASAEATLPLRPQPPSLWPSAPLVLVAYVQRFPDRVYIMYITWCNRNLVTYCIQATPSCMTHAKVEPFWES